MNGLSLILGLIAGVALVLLAVDILFSVIYMILGVRDEQSLGGRLMWRMIEWFKQLVL